MPCPALEENLDDSVDVLDHHEAAVGVISRPRLGLEPIDVARDMLLRYTWFVATREALDEPG